MVKKKLASAYPQPVAYYLDKAKTQEGNEQQHSFIQAAGRLIYDGQWRQGLAILTQTQGLTADQLNEKQLLMAKVGLIRGRSKSVLIQLSGIKKPEQLSTTHKIQYHRLLAQSHDSSGHLKEAFSERVKLEHLLAETKGQRTNQKALWFILTNMPQAQLDGLVADTSEDPEMQGWLQLQAISRKYPARPQSLLAALDDWQTRFSAHSANHILPNSLDSMANKLINQPKKIALLVPLSGVLSGPGQAIRDGFMAAFKANSSQAAIKVKAYDTSQGDIKAIYQKAINKGADYIIGPLTKQDVASIAAIEHPVPTLLLNDADVSLHENAYLFGLSPANEATQVAIKARSKGYGRALIIAPKDAWGQEVTKAFKSQWKKQGGQIAGALLYGPNEDMNQGIRTLLQITRSQEREKQLKQVLGRHLQAAVGRRQDFDVIFLLAYPSKARQIRPLLNYYYAGDVPVYATSSVYSGHINALKDKDLNGIIFCDMPWVFSHQMGVRHWPEQFNSYNRLYAVGKDSYALATQLNHLMLFPVDGSMDTGGTLYLKSSHQVARVLEWGQFKQGLAHSMGRA